MIPRARVFAIADGTGGRPDGLRASELAVSALEDYFRQARACPAPENGSGAAAVSDVKGAIAQANARIWSENADRVAAERMTAAIVVAHFLGPNVAIASVGHARAYRLRDRKLKRLTADHILLEQSRPYLSDDDLEPLRPLQDVLTRALGFAARVAADVMTHSVAPEDCFLVCSSGLTDALPDPAICDIMLSASSLEDMCQALTRAADAAHGRDNITAMAIRLGRAAAAPS